MNGMPLIVHVTQEDLAGWELTHKSPAGLPVSSSRERAHDTGLALNYHYRPRNLAGEEYEQIQVIAPAPLEELVDQDLVCHLNTEKGWMSKKVGAHPEVKFQLRWLSRLLEGSPRRFRLRIHAIDTTRRPPWVQLEEFNEEDE